MPIYELTEDKEDLYAGLHEIRFDLKKLKKILLQFGETEENLTDKALNYSDKFYYINTYINNTNELSKLQPDYIAFGELNFSKHDSIYIRIYYNL